MRITGFEIERFGIWSGLSVPRLFPGVNVFYGANEAGKSTLMEFVRAELYGFGGERRRYARKPGGQHADWNGEVDHEGRSLYVASGGVLQLECPSGSYRLRRTFHPDRPGNEEKIDLRTLDDEKQGAQLLRVLVSGVDEATFNNVFAIGLDELQRLGSLGDTEAAEMLFRLSVGMDRVSIVEAIKELTARRNRILDVSEKENKPSRLTKLLRRRETLVEELAATKLSVREYVRIRDEQRSVDRSVAKIEEELAALQREKRLDEIAGQAEPIWLRRDRVRTEIDGMGTVAVVSDDVVTQLDDIGRRLEQKQSAYDRLKEEYLRARDAVRTQPVNETLWKLAPRIEVLLEEEKRIIEIDGQITGLENEISTLERRVIDEETQIKRGRRSLPIPPSKRRTSGDETVRDDPAERERLDEKPVTEHASFSASGAVISAPSTLPSIPVSAKGHRPNVESADLIDAETLEDYRVPARRVSRAKHRLQRAREQHSELLGRVKVLNEKVKSELTKRDFKELPEAIEKVGEAVTHLGRRQAISQRLAEMSIHQKELQRINAFLVRHQALPTWIVALVGIVCALGAVLVGLPLFELLGLKAFEASVPPVTAVLGVLLIGGSIALKFLSEKNNARKLEQNQRQLGMLLTQLEHARQEAAAIDARYPANGTTSIEVRYREAQQELSHLEKLVPVDAQRQEANRQFKQAEVRLERAKEEHAAATKRWSDWLRTSGLPTDWTPGRIRDLMEHCDVVGDLKKELDHRYESMNQRIRDMRNITDRIDRMIVESGLSFEDGMSYVDILGEIRKKLEANDEAIRKRDKLKDGIRQFRGMRKKAVSDLRKARRDENDLLRRFGVKTKDELRELHRRHLKHRRLLQQEQGIQRELDAAIGGFCDESEIGALLEPRLDRNEVAAQKEEGFAEKIETEEKADEIPSLDDLVKSVLRRIETLSTKLHDELELRGRLGEQLKLIAEDQTAIRKQRELAILDEKIKQARMEWQTYAVCARMLDTIRSTYERERQPRTLAEASQLLGRLTDGKYRRIWTPLGEETLLVDDDQGNTFDVAWLSRGTREQLFIALRLALASAFAQHGSILPLILDDVLVNFDSKRAFAAAKVLLEFAASGRQVFLFTCHEHVCRMFQKLDVPVRILPSVNDPGKPTKVLLPLSILKKREEKRRRVAARQAAARRRKMLDEEISQREEAIRLEALRKAEVQRLILQMQQQATAEKAVEADRRGFDFGIPFSSRKSSENVAETDDEPPVDLDADEDVDDDAEGDFDDE